MANLTTSSCQCDTYIVTSTTSAIPPPFELDIGDGIVHHFDSTPCHNDHVDAPDNHQPPTTRRCICSNPNHLGVHNYDPDDCGGRIVIDRF